MMSIALMYGLGYMQWNGLEIWNAKVLLILVTTSLISSETASIHCNIGDGIITTLFL